jgi:predicted phage terminase large subunit-like protein
LLHTPALGDFDWLPPEAPRDEDGRGSLWPAQWSLEWLLRERARLGSAQWGTVWMGDPVPVGAGVFQAEWFRPYTRELAQALQGRLTTVAFVDTAWSSKETSDYSCACVVAYDPRDPVRTLYVTGWFRKRIDEAGLPDALAAFFEQTRPRYIGVEVPAFRQAATMELKRQLEQRLNGRLAAAVVPVPTATDKVTRARVPAAKAEAGQLYVDKGLPLWPAIERELIGFPMMAHDDAPDALAGACTLAIEASGVGQEGQAMARPVRARFG